MKNKKIARALSIIFALIAVFFGYKSVSETMILRQEVNKLEEIQNSVNKENAEMKADHEKLHEIIPEYNELHEQNPEFYGWIKIDDTLIDYPVMFTPEEPEKYLHTDFDGEYSYAGLPFLDARSTEESDCYIIYGHNMKNQTMFQNIMKYNNVEFYKQHKIIKFNTLYEKQEFEVMAAFYDKVYLKNYEGFKFYNFVDAENAEEFDNAVRYFKEKSVYDTGIDAEYGDKLLMLVTCSSHTNEGRFVVVAKQCAEKNE